MTVHSNLYALGDHHPNLPEDGNYWIAPDARVIGQVTLHSGASIWWGSVLRGDNEPIIVGAGSNIQEHCVCHVDPGFRVIIGENCTIGHKAILHGCTVGDGSLIGMGATVLNGAKIGKNCLVGAGALVTEGMVVPDGSLVIGTPAKIKKQLSPEAIAGLRRSAEKYQWNKDQFKTKLTPL
jgi:carbonic anhydrase/acetyltransferase-like protein (isoleucine patch superfamily)